MNGRLTKEWVIKHLPKRPESANKGTFGKVLVIAGSKNYPGAAYLSCAAAYRVGAGLVTLATTLFVKFIISKKIPEVTFLDFAEVFQKIKDYEVIILGPGLGQNAEISRFVKKHMKKKLPPVLIDGDGLNILSKIDGWWKRLTPENILTPHPQEMSKLTGWEVGQIQDNRKKTAKEFAKKWNQVVILKGANTIVASPAGEVKVSPFVNPLLATAGTGDILSGIIGGFLAQGLTPFDAALVGVYIHGLAAEILSGKLGQGGALASDLLPLLPKVINNLRKKV